jgi:hypothetical protein
MPPASQLARPMLETTRGKLTLDIAGRLIIRYLDERVRPIGLVRVAVFSPEIPCLYVWGVVNHTITQQARDQQVR